MLYLPILVPKFWQEIWCQNMQKGGEVQGWNTREMAILTAGDIFAPYFLPKLVSIAFSLRPEEALLVLTLQKLV